MSKKESMFTKSSDTSIIERRLMETNPGDVVTYAELSRLLGRDVLEHCRGNLTGALRMVQREGLFFDCVRREGYKRLSDDEAPKAVLGHYVGRVKAAAHNGIKASGRMNMAKMSEDTKRSFLVSQAQLGAAEMFATTKTAKKIESKIDAAATTTLPIGETLKLFGG